MKKLLFLLIIIAGCSDLEMKTQVYEKTEPAIIGLASPNTVEVCEGKAFTNNVYGSYANPIPFLTPITSHFYFNSNGLSSLSYTVTIKITNNNNFAVTVYKNGSYYTVLQSNAYTTFSFTRNCTCGVGNCFVSEDVYYNWSIKTSPVIPGQVAQVTMNASINSPHTISPSSGVFLFGN